MVIVSLLSWWYGRGWKEVTTSFMPRVNNIAESFSFQQLLRTLFSPWRRIVSYPGRSFDARLRAMLDNAVSRVIGFIVRAGVLIAGCLAIVGIIILTGLEAILWPLLPLLIPVGLIAGFLL